MRRPIIAGNWKMYKTIAEAIELVNGIKRELFELDFQSIDVVVCPPFTALSEASEVLSETEIGLGAQNVHWEEEGAFTGEVSCKMLKDAGVNFVIIGHSERRQFFFETDETVNKRLKSVLDAQLVPIMCIGETLSERETGETFTVIERQLKNGLKGVGAEQAEKIIIAYEPVWAIGTGKTATPEQAEEVHNFIRNNLTKIFSESIAQTIRIQYGGSVKPANIKELMQQPDIDGALVGGASLQIDSFVQIVKLSQEAVK